MLFARDREGGGPKDVEVEGIVPSPREESYLGLKEASATIRAVSIKRGVRELALRNARQPGESIFKVPTPAPGMGDDVTVRSDGSIEPLLGEGFRRCTRAQGSPFSAGEEGMPWDSTNAFCKKPPNCQKIPTARETRGCPPT
jgi:hypothetical protein